MAQDLDAKQPETDESGADQGEGDGRPTEQPAGSADDGGFGKPIGERAANAIGNTQRAAKAVQKLGSGLGKAAKVATTVFGPGSKIKIGAFGIVIVIDVFVYLLAPVLLVIGIMSAANGNSGKRGTSPEQQPDLTQTEIQNDLKLIACLDSAPPAIPQTKENEEKATTDATKDADALLSDECRKLNTERVAKAKARVADLRIQLKQRSAQASGTDKTPHGAGFNLIQTAQAAEPNATNSSRSETVQKASKLLDDMDAALTGISNANGKYKATKEYSDKLNLLIPQFADVWSTLAFNCEGAAELVDGGIPKNDLYKLKSGPNITFFYGAASRPNTYATKNMACYLATLTAEAKSQLGLAMEVGDLSTSTGEQAWGPHHQHGGGGNVDIWAPKVMSADLQQSTFDGELSVKFAKLIIDLGGQELFITQDAGYPNAIKQYSVYAGGHADHWHICISSCN